MIDRVTVKGSLVPVDLYTVDFFSYPDSFGCSCTDPTHFMDACFTDENVAHTQRPEPAGV